MSNRVTFLGTGTSQGVPVIGCDCPVCRSGDIHDRRLRSSILVEYDGLKLLVDAGPDFRQQMLRAGSPRPDAILLTHHHVDHTGGLDDVRALNHLENRDFPIYCERNVEESLRKQFYYAFSSRKYPGAPGFDIRTITSNPFEIEGRKIIPIRAMHYKLPILGFRFGDFAYVTDANYIPESEFVKLEGVNLFVVNTVRRGKHISHFSLEEAVGVCNTVGAERSYLTHISHLLPPHRELSAELPAGILPAYDGLSVEF